MIKRFFKTQPELAPQMADSLALGLKMDQLGRLARRLDGLDYAEAARAGVYPAELDAIRAMRLTGLEPDRLQSLLETLAGPGG